MESNRVLLELGSFGKWQISNYLILCISVMVMPAWQSIAIVYIGFKPEHHCKVPSNIPLNQSIPIIDGKLSSCLMYRNSSVNNDVTTCMDGWTYLEDHGPTFVTQWDLVCDKSHLAQIPQTIYMVGSIFGSVFFAALSDKLGRKTVFLFCHWVTVLLGSVSVLAPNLVVFCVIRFFLGAFSHSIIIVGFILTCESFAAPHRTFVGTVIENFWALALCLLPFVAFLLRNWMHLQLFISLAGLLTVPLYWLLPESVLWLEINGKTDKAEKIFQKAAKINKINLPSPIYPPKIFENGVDRTKDKKGFSSKSLLHSFKRLFRSETDEDNHIYPTKQLFRNKTLRKHLLLTSMLWLSVIMVYFAFTLTTAQLAGNHYLNGFLSGLMEFPAYISSYFIMVRFGRRYSLIGYQAVSGVALVMQVIMSKVNLGPYVNHSIFVVMFNMIGKLGIAGAYGSLDLFAPELFPTTLRNQAQGMASVFGRIGTIASSFLPFILEKNDWLPLIVMSLMVVLGCTFVFLLPETIHRDLPNSIQEIESWTVVVVVEKKLENEEKENNGKVDENKKKKKKMEGEKKKEAKEEEEEKTGVINKSYMEDTKEDLNYKEENINSIKISKVVTQF